MDAVHEDVDAAEALRGRTDETLGISGDREVTRDGEGFGALRLDFFRGLAKRLFAARRQGEATALF